MTSQRQIQSNRRNAAKSTGPRTAGGKQRAAQNARRHGLTAETVITPLEDAEDYAAFEESITSTFEAESAVERELILRLASLLWRLRRATIIETGLLQIQGDILRERRSTRSTQTPSPDYVITSIIPLRPLRESIFTDDVWSEARNCPNDQSEPDQQSLPPGEPTASPDVRFDLARCFLRLANLDSGVFERLGRYETALWRQVRQTLFTLEAFRWHPPNGRHPGGSFTGRPVMRAHLDDCV